MALFNNLTLSLLARQSEYGDLLITGLDATTAASHHPIRWAVHVTTTAVEHVGVDHRCPHIGVPEHLPRAPDVVAVFQQVRANECRNAWHAAEHG